MITVTLIAILTVILIVISHDNKYLYIMGGCDQETSYHRTNIFWKFSIVVNHLDWNIERLLWIAFYKSDNNENDIVKVTKRYNVANYKYVEIRKHICNQ